MQGFKLLHLSHPFPSLQLAGPPFGPPNFPLPISRVLPPAHVPPPHSLLQRYPTTLHNSPSRISHTIPFPSSTYIVVTSDKEVQFNVEISTAVFLTKGLGVWIGSVSAISGVGDRVLLGDEQGVGGRVQVGGVGGEVVLRFDVRKGEVVG